MHRLLVEMLTDIRSSVWPHRFDMVRMPALITVRPHV